MNKNEDQTVFACKGSTHNFECITFHDRGYLEWEFSVKQKEPVTFIFHDIDNAGTTRSTESISVQLISKTNCNGTVMYTSTARVSNIEKPMTIKCSTPPNDIKEYNLLIQGLSCTNSS